MIITETRRTHKRTAGRIAYSGSLMPSSTAISCRVSSAVTICSGLCSEMTQKRSRVYITALIVIFWDISLGVACFLGAGALMQALPWLQKVILGLGSLIVIYIGIGLLRSKASLEGGRDVNVPVWKLITSAFVVTWLNPQAIIDGTMMLGAFRATLPAGTDVPFICGFGSASVIWFLTVSTLVSLLGSKFNEKVLNVINKVCGAVIIFYGLKLLYSFVKMMGWL